MPLQSLQYLHVYVFTYSSSVPITLFEKVISYYPSFQVGGELTFILTENFDINNECEVKSYIVKEIRNIIITDKNQPLKSQHTLYVRVGTTSREIDMDEDESKDHLDINYFLSNMHSN